MNYLYRAYDGDGKERSGTVEADDLSEAEERLALLGIRPFSIRSSEKTGTTPNPKRSHFGRLFGSGQLSQTRLFTDLAVLTGAGLTITQALRAMSEGETVAAQRQAITTVMGAMSAGIQAAGAFALIREIRPDTLGMIAAGERTARLPDVFRSLAASMTDAESRRKQVTEALAYPAFLMAMMLIAFGIVTFVLIPSLAPIFEGSQRPVPFVISFFDVLRLLLAAPATQLVLVIVTGSLLALVMPSTRTVVGPYAFRFLMRLPFASRVITRFLTARYLGSLAMLIEGGTPMREALSLAAGNVQFPIHAAAFRLARDDVASGIRLPSALSRTGIFDEKTIALIAVGDEANQLPTVLDRASNILRAQADESLARAIGTLTPAMTIILGIVIGALVVSVMTALLSINEIVVQG